MSTKELKQFIFMTGLALGMLEGGMHFIITAFPRSNLISFWVNCVSDPCKIKK